MPNCDLNYDCFNCIYKDCIDNTSYDPLNPLQRSQQPEPRKTKFPGTSGKEYARAYYLANREKIIEAAKERQRRKKNESRTNSVHP